MAGLTGQQRIAPTAARLTVLAARLLPIPDRARYGAEYRSELYELVRAGKGRRPQLAYAARQLGLAWRLRAAVGASRRRVVP
jgi:hypothetical protein